MRADYAVLRALVATKVVEVLGRTPMNKAEGARVRQEIYRSNPGLLGAIVKAERGAGGGGTPRDDLVVAMGALQQARANASAGELAAIDAVIAQLTGLVGAP